MKRPLLLLLALVITAGSMVGCGQKGPLYLPGSETAKERHKDRFEF
ncbi:LPS translocon maturation chaperone LptM [Azomonas macrocytogenes]|uniref:Putative small lipoprotein YifL n=1 Tax=Azomonas macrocytogenes TaxID=69962 RepID=A0A839T6L8_AZOMA|nr:lipoprotein [Azomonas macrocytogenes]MBB3103323.1 putative small lipoprotein YifL [Azomonas macrocytogenes]